ncbi:hypothetical protein I302_108296 [Kwoniella bestiolae CBS 10118]|uniref:Uncharacterized protein n=1 Tax=Kwoniella bestiolae CBS 10118 TaxID=1296100 RepID=A0A1B9FW38_9TREE|nr:hypothetical protein I302_07336 [Kwoniella bestiolae CBS 10118]OCF22986.1 hypothetical protein I302_07336 [Kwoniella bestiolae CBS 10118]
MRTMCYAPGPIEQADLSEFSMVNDANQIESELPEISSSTSATTNAGAVDSGIDDMRLEASEMQGVVGKVAA